MLIKKKLDLSPPTGCKDSHPAALEDSWSSIKEWLAEQAKIQHKEEQIVHTPEEMTRFDNTVSLVVVSVLSSSSSCPVSLMGTPFTNSLLHLHPLACLLGSGSSFLFGVSMPFHPSPPQTYCTFLSFLSLLTFWVLFLMLMKPTHLEELFRGSAHAPVSYVVHSPSISFCTILEYEKKKLLRIATFNEKIISGN